MKPRSAAMEQRAVEKWNAAHAIGTPVTVRLDSGTTLDTTTRSEAWLMGGHSAMILLRGISGGYSLDCVTAKPLQLSPAGDVDHGQEVKTS